MHHDIIGTRASRVTDEVIFTQGSAAMLTESPLHLGSEPPPGACISVGAPASLDALYDALERTWPLPSWFGRNLDALYDVLTSPAGDAPRVLRFDALPPLPADTQRALITIALRIGERILLAVKIQNWSVVLPKLCPEMRPSRVKPVLSERTFGAHASITPRGE
jgi:RNAse (barnase) inhibitor barstar